jgi:hypothetical protein
MNSDRFAKIKGMDNLSSSLAWICLALGAVGLVLGGFRGSESNDPKCNPRWSSRHYAPKALALFHVMPCPSDRIESMDETGFLAIARRNLMDEWRPIGVG